ncbi:NAD(P)/FAD-dependent oxidoreductase [Bacillus sp. FJAT-42376]|nr:NAD(P)/FAD-dependent oxidoreductase [Bacillus sp. FJAT-42376]
MNQLILLEVVYPFRIHFFLNLSQTTSPLRLVCKNRKREFTMKKYEAAIIGGGISGLTAAVYLAKAGISTVVIEKGKALGGRAKTVKKNGAYFNIGAHALYKGGAAEAVLDELGIELSGGVPDTKGRAIWNGSIFSLPASLPSLLSTKLLSLSGKIELGKVMRKLMNLKPASIGERSLRDWAESEMTDPMVRHAFYALCRTSTYCIGPENQQAAIVLDQVQRGMNGVFYIDGGWQSMIDPLKKKAIDFGADIVHQSAVSIKKKSGFEITLKNGDIIQVPMVLSTASPEQTFSLIEGAAGTSLETWRQRVKPIYAACLDVSLRHLPKPNEQFAIGIDQPILFTNQSRAAQLSDNGSSVISLIKYLGTDSASNAQSDQRELENFLELMQPGWRKELEGYQYLPHITVSNGSCAMNGYLPLGPSVPDIPGLYIAGDGAGRTELLADAAFASAKRASALMIQKCANPGILKEA